MRPLHDPAPGVSTFGEIAWVLGFLALVHLGLAVFAWRERHGRVTFLGLLAERVGDLDRTPRWAAMSPALQTGSLLLCGFGVWWDIAVHIDFGRDEGPFGTPAHYPIFLGLLGIMVSGVVSAVLAREPLPRGSLRLTRHWRVPPSAAFVILCSTFSLAGFPLDDVWHRIFGVDVTLWGPTHLLMIGGAVISMLSLLLLRAETAQVAGPRRRHALLDVSSCGALLIGLQLFATEFDFGLPQFPLAVHPVLLALAAALPLVLARLRGGPGSALAAVAVYLAVRGAITVAVAVPLGRSLATFPLFVVEALLVEAVVLVMGARPRFRTGVVAGGLVGTVGLLAEYAWTHQWSPQPWSPDMVAPMLAHGALVGAGAGAVAAWLAARVGEVAGQPPAPGTPPGRSHRYAALSLVAVALPFLLTVPRSATEDVRADVTLEPAAGGGTAAVTVRLEPPTAAEGARWFRAVSWQGGSIRGGEMVRVADGVYRAPQPMPVDGPWKSIIRLHRGDSDLTALLVRMPGDAAVGKPEVAARSGVREFVHEREALRREEDPDVPAWGWAAGNALLGVVALLEVGALGWLLARAGAAGRAGQGDGDARAAVIVRASGAPPTPAASARPGAS